MDSSVAPMGPVGVVSAEKVAAGRERILNELRKVIVGQDDVVEQVLIALFTGGHCLITGVPGLAKTLLIKTLAEILDLDFKRIQFTPDIMPSDITGTDIIQEDPATGRRQMVFAPGPIFANIVLADEINRTPFTVIWYSCIASSSAACVLGGVRLISSARSRLVNTGPSRKRNDPSFGSKMT